MCILLKLNYAKFGVANLFFFQKISKTFGGRLDPLGKGRVKKLRCEEGLKVEQSLKSFIEEDLSDSAASNSNNDEVSENDSANLTGSNTHFDMSEDVPIHLDRRQKSNFHSHDEQAERKLKFFTEEEDETLKHGLQS